MASEDISRLVEPIGRARLAGRPLENAGQLLQAADGEFGYDIQSALADWLTAHGQGNLAGYKVGATTKDMQAALNVTGPVYGHILSSNVLQSGRTFACTPDSRPGIECEIAFRFGEDLPLSSSPYTRDQVAERIDAVIPAIEIVENRYGEFRQCSLALLTADDFFHKACVLGDPIPGWRKIDLPETIGRTCVNGAWVETGQGSNVLGHPLEAVIWLANKLAERDTALKAGQIVMTGSMTPVHWIDDFPSDNTIEIIGLGQCSVELTARL